MRIDPVAASRLSGSPTLRTDQAIPQQWNRKVGGRGQLGRVESNLVAALLVTASEQLAVGY